MVAEPRIYRASSLGYSLERMVAPHLGYQEIPPPEWLQKAYDKGNELEPIIIEKLRADGWFIDSEQREVELDIIPGVAKVVGHLDGIVHYQTERGRVLEIKTMAEEMWDRVVLHGWGAGGIMEKYKWQQSAYVLATGLGHVLACYNKADGQMIFTIHDEPFYPLSDIVLKVAEAERYVEMGQLPDGCEDWPCPYFPYHAPTEEPEPADEELDNLLTAWQKVNAAKKEWEKSEKGLRAMILEYVGEIAGKVKGSQGITVSTNWVEAQDVSYTKPAHWETRITAARERKVKEESVDNATSDR